MITMLDIMTYLLDRCASGLPGSALSEVFDQLIWCLNDNGKEIEDVRRKWLFSDNRREVEVALFMSETFPFSTFSEMKDCFDKIGDKWPDLDHRCNDVLVNWKKQFPEN